MSKIPPEIDKKIRELVRERLRPPACVPVKENERLRLKALRRIPEASEVIDLKLPQEPGEMVFSYINGRWRNASYEIRRAEEDNKRMEIKVKAGERL